MLNILIGFVCLCNALLIAGPGEGAVKIFVSDEFGRPLLFSVRSFRHSILNAELAGRFNGLSAEHVPFGVYRAVLDRKGDERGANSIEALINVDRPLVGVILFANRLFVPGAAVDSMTPVGYCMTFRIKGGVAGGPPVRIRVMSLTNRANEECVVGDDGACEIRTYLRGLYHLVVIKGDDVLYSETLSIQGRAVTPEREIELSPSKQAVYELP